MENNKCIIYFFFILTSLTALMFLKEHYNFYIIKTQAFSESCYSTKQLTELKKLTILES